MPRAYHCGCALACLFLHIITYCFIPVRCECFLECECQWQKIAIAWYGKWTITPILHLIVIVSSFISLRGLFNALQLIVMIRTIVSVNVCEQCAWCAWIKGSGTVSLVAQQLFISFSLSASSSLVPFSFFFPSSLHFSILLLSSRLSFQHHLFSIPLHPSPSSHLHHSPCRRSRSLQGMSSSTMSMSTSLTRPSYGGSPQRERTFHSASSSAGHPHAHLC